MSPSFLILLFRFNSRTPGGVRLFCIVSFSSEISFQFTHPGRGATRIGKRHFPRDVVSIHAPREGCDTSTPITTIHKTLFQFTHPGRGATMIVGAVRSVRSVSIHAPREGCDGAPIACE